MDVNFYNFIFLSKLIIQPSILLLNLKKMTKIGQNISNSGYQMGEIGLGIAEIEI